MKARGRPRAVVPLNEVKIRLPEELCAIMDLVCLDPLTSKLRYGLRNALVEHALTEYFANYYPRKTDKPLDNLPAIGHDETIKGEPK